MKFRNSSLFLILPILAAIITSCNKDTGLPSFADACVEGTDGNITVHFKAAHHSKIIPSLPGHPDSLFIKFNTDEFPGDNPSGYDVVLAGSAPDTFIVVNNLQCGRYYVFMTGYDNGIAARVKGGIPLKIADDATDLQITVPVTEE